MRARINRQDIENLSCKLDLLSQRIDKEITHSKQKMEILKVRVANLEDKLGNEKKYSQLKKQLIILVYPYISSIS